MSQYLTTNNNTQYRRVIHEHMSYKIEIQLNENPV